MQQSEAHLFQNRPAIQWLSIQPQHGGGNLAFRAPNPTRNAIINYYLSDKVTGDVRFESRERRRSQHLLGDGAVRRDRLHAGHRPHRVDDAVDEPVPARRPRAAAVEAEAAADAAGPARAVVLARLSRRRGRRGGRSAGSRRSPGARSGVSHSSLAQSRRQQADVAAVVAGVGGRGGGGGAQRAEPGTYRVTMTANGKTYTSTVTLRPDPLER